MSRVQLALNVPNVEEAVDFYSKLFGAQPHKRKRGYANFSIVDPPLKLVLFERADAEGRLDHLGIEVADSDEVRGHRQRLALQGVEAAQGSGTCCFAEQDKVWIDGPDGAWEIYTVLADSESFGVSTGVDGGRAERPCCGEPEV